MLLKDLLAQGADAIGDATQAHVVAFFATTPYGKFAHGVYRGAALLKWSADRRLPTRLRLGSE